MASATGDFSKGKVSSAILRIGLPMMAAEFVNVLYNLVDRMYIGHLEGTGTVALTGIGICFPLISLISAFSGFCGSGGAPLSSIARGAGQEKKAKRIQETSFTLMLAVGLFLTLLLFPLAPALLRLLGGDDETLPYALLLPGGLLSAAKCRGDLLQESKCHCSNVSKFHGFKVSRFQHLKATKHLKR